MRRSLRESKLITESLLSYDGSSQLSVATKYRVPSDLKNMGNLEMSGNLNMGPENSGNSLKMMTCRPCVLHVDSFSGC